jgi:hypothetical protein
MKGIEVFWMGVGIGFIDVKKWVLVFHFFVEASRVEIFIVNLFSFLDVLDSLLSCYFFW